MSVVLTVESVIVLRGFTAIERCLLVLATALMLIVELLNSAIKSVVHRISLEHHALSGQVKAMGSAAILLSLIFWCYAWFEVLIIA